MSATDRLRNERIFHDRQAQLRAAYFESRPNELQFTSDSYLDHETWVRPAMDQLGDLAGLRVLDYGCGHGMAAVVVARRGARVTAFDLSGGYLAEAAARAQENRVDVEFVQANGEHLPFADRSFDRIWGNAILHHLDMERAGRELCRVLAPGGIAVFCEPWGGNPLVNFARRMLPYSGKGRTPDERPLGASDLRILRGIFPSVEVCGIQLLSMIQRFDPPDRLAHNLNAIDELLLKQLPILQRLCRYAVITLRK
jgi:2-polyprenyl-3-methyl-5-hydroxy-6-metoxy-1,4-benzoquinol methylase